MPPMSRVLMTHAQSPAAAARAEAPLQGSSRTSAGPAGLCCREPLTGGSGDAFGLYCGAAGARDAQPLQDRTFFAGANRFLGHHQPGICDGTERPR